MSSTQCANAQVFCQHTVNPEPLADSGACLLLPAEAVDYFTRALGREAAAAGKRLDAAPEVLDKLRAAVFDEGRSLPELRGEFGPLLRPKANEAEDAVSRARSAAQRLLSLLPNVPGITEARMARTCAALEALVRDLDEMSPEKAEASAARTSRAKRKEPAEA